MSRCNLEREISVSGPCLVQIDRSIAILARSLLFFVLTKKELMHSLNRLSVLLLFLTVFNKEEALITEDGR